jgi:hypothetical protein
LPGGKDAFSLKSYSRDTSIGISILVISKLMLLGYAYKEKAFSWSRSAGLQVPLDVTTKGSKTSILTEKDIVNYIGV